MARTWQPLMNIVLYYFLSRRIVRIKLDKALKSYLTQSWFLVIVRLHFSYYSPAS